MIYTNHAIHQYAIRTGRYALEAREPLVASTLNARVVGYPDILQEGFSIIKRQEGDTYLVWEDDNIHEDICGILNKQGVLKTVLTKKMYTWCRKGCKIRHESGGIYDARSV